jgi:hypothetical protein
MKTYFSILPVLLLVTINGFLQSSSKRMPAKASTKPKTKVISPVIKQKVTKAKKNSPGNPLIYKEDALLQKNRLKTLIIKAAKN